MQKKRSLTNGTTEAKIILLALIFFLTAAVFLILRSHGYLLEGRIAFVLMLFIRLSILFFAAVFLTSLFRDSKIKWKKILFGLCLCGLVPVAYLALKNPIRDLAVWPSTKTETVYNGYFKKIHTNSRRPSDYYRLQGLSEDGDVVSYDLNKSTYLKYVDKGGSTYQVTCTPYTESVINVKLQ
ncbi:hypothetical protein [Catenisphaera adipataccumulans]|uniref:Uncharacterized protein n=1 Tax=Catenisphaera adipataccumulans TaxID=700500 RepID=A0A7W8CWK5_9FIRM|nr:hypothetical protein [Catenisphaera adipataccumulans]MBB5182656.1 hypothetical protein [Catenisphaera adipataccumulans]